MGPLLRDLTVLQVQYPVAELCGGQPVGDEQRGLLLGHFLVSQINLVLGDRIQGCRGLVQHQDGCVLVERPGQHQFLGFAAGQRDAVCIELLVQLRVDALWQGAQLLAQARQLQALSGPPEVGALSNLSGDRLRQGEKAGLHILEDRGEQAVVVLPAEFPDRDAVDFDIPFRGQVQPAQELHQSGLARAVEPYQSHLLPGVQGEVQVLQGIAVGAFVAEGHMFEGNLGSRSQKLRHIRFPGAVLLRQIQILPVIAEIQAGGPDTVPLSHDVADEGGEHGDGREIQKEPVHCQLASQRHFDQQGISRAVPQQDDEQVGYPGEEASPDELPVPECAPGAQVGVNLSEPPGTAIDADILPRPEIGSLALDIPQPVVYVGPLVPVGVLPVPVGPGAEPVDGGGDGQDWHQQGADEGNHRAEQEVAEDVLYQLHAAAWHIGDRLHTIPLLRGEGGPVAKFPDILALVVLEKTGHGFSVHFHVFLETIFCQIIGLGQPFGKGAQDICRQHQQDDHAYAECHTGQGGPSRELCHHKGREVDLCEGKAYV